jgi:hypothetical protein
VKRERDLVAELTRELERVRARLELLAPRRDVASVELREELEIEQRWIERRLERTKAADK